MSARRAGGDREGRLVSRNDIAHVPGRCKHVGLHHLLAPPSTSRGMSALSRAAGSDALARASHMQGTRKAGPTAEVHSGATAGANGANGTHRDVGAKSLHLRQIVRDVHGCVALHQEDCSV